MIRHSHCGAKKLREVFGMRHGTASDSCLVDAAANVTSTQATWWDGMRSEVCDAGDPSSLAGRLQSKAKYYYVSDVWNDAQQCPNVSR